jgi:hypothetical protein
MLIYAREKGWHLALTAKHYGMHKSSIAAACERLGVVLPMHQFSPQRVSPRSKAWADVIDGETRPKTKLSASKASIERALAKMATESGCRQQIEIVT